MDEERERGMDLRSLLLADISVAISVDIWRRMKTELAQLAAESEDAILRTGGAGALTRFEEFCMKRFDVVAKHSVPFGNPTRGTKVNPGYIKILKIQKRETMRQFSHVTASLDRDVRKEHCTRLSYRLDARMRWWLAAIEKVLLDKDKKPFLINARAELSNTATRNQHVSSAMASGQQTAIVNSAEIESPQSVKRRLEAFGPKKLVNFQIAAEYAGVGEDYLRRLTNSDPPKIATEGRAQQKKVVVASLIQYFPPE